MCKLLVFDRNTWNYTIVLYRNILSYNCEQKKKNSLETTIQKCKYECIMYTIPQPLGIKQS